jgi:ribosomal protein S6E (S10)
MSNYIWLQVGQDIDGEADFDNSGRSVSLSADGSRVAIGAPYNDGTSGSNRGQTRIYQLSGNTWVQVGQDIDGEAVGDESGTSVSLSADGSRVAIGAPYNNGAGNISGQTRIYDLSGNTWVQVGQDIDGEADFDISGRSVSLSADGSRVAIGAPYNDGTSGSNRGQTRIYQLSGNTWIQVGQDIDGEAVGDESGLSVSLNADGSRVAIGAPGNDGTSGSNRGQTRIYELSGNTWVQVGQDIDGEAAFDQSSRSVSLSADGSRVAIGAPYNYGTSGSNRGQTRIYQLSGNTWIQVGQDIDGEAVGDESGLSVSLNADGSRVAIGAPGNDGTSGSYSGQTRIYELSGNTWVQVGQDIDGEYADDWSGWSVSLSADGSRVAIGAPRNDGTSGINSGQTRIYQLKTVTTLSVPNTATVIYGSVPLNIDYNSNSNGHISSSSSDTSVATTSGTTVTPVAPGTATLTFNQEATPIYTSASAQTELTVLESSPSEPVPINNGAGLEYFFDTGSRYGILENRGPYEIMVPPINRTPSPGEPVYMFTLNPDGSVITQTYP